MVRTRWFAVFILTLAVACQPTKVNCSTKQVESTGLDRTVLPIREPAVPAITALDARNAKAPARFQVTAPEKLQMLLMCCLTILASAIPVLSVDPSICRIWKNWLPMPQVSFLGKAKEKYYGADDQIFERSIKSQLNSIDFGATAAVTYLLSTKRGGKGMNLQLRYYQGFSNVYKTGGKNTNNVFSFNLEFPFISDDIAKKNISL